MNKIDQLNSEQCSQQATYVCVGLCVIDAESVRAQGYDIEVEKVRVLVKIPGRRKSNDGETFFASVVTGHIDNGQTIEETIKKEALEEYGVEVALLGDARKPLFLFEPKEKIGSKKFSNIIAAYICLYLSMNKNNYEDKDQAKVVSLDIGTLLKEDIDGFTREVIEELKGGRNFKKFLRDAGLLGSDKEEKSKLFSFFRKKKDKPQIHDREFGVLFVIDFYRIIPGGVLAVRIPATAVKYPPFFCSALD